jgi:hypothetical protein
MLNDAHIERCCTVTSRGEYPFLQVVQVEDQRQVDTTRLSAMRLGSTADFGRQFLDGADAPTSPMAMA